MKITSSVYTDKLELCDPKTGEVVKEIPFTINFTATFENVLQKRYEMSQISTDDPEAMGKSFIELLSAIFGEEVANSLLDYFKDDYLMMITDLAPYLTAEIFPVYERFTNRAAALRKKPKK